MAGVFLAVVAVVIGASAATGWRAHQDQAPAASAHVRINPAVDPAADLADSAEQSQAGLLSQIPDTSIAAGDGALHARAGVLVAQGDKFRIEKVALTTPVTVSVQGTSITADSVYRVTITAGPYVMRDMAAIVSINNRPLAMGMESADLASLMAFTFDSSVLTSGASLAVSYGLPDQTNTVWSSSVEVIK